MRKKSMRSVLSATVLAFGFAGGAQASLTAFQSYVGNVGLSTSGFGSTTQAGSITATVPIGATVLNAYLYTSTFGSFSGAGGTLSSNTLSYTNLGTNSSPSVLTAGRADVTSIVKPLIDGGPGGLYIFRVTETSSSQDGEALVVVYTLPSLAVSTIGILDGFSQSSGDSFVVNFASPLNPIASGFVADLRLGIGFSFDGTGCTNSGQTSRVTVNSTVITNSAGCNDDSVDASPNNGNLITVGGNNDAFSALLPSVSADHERYNLTPQIGVGDTTIKVNTFNASNDDNIFLAVLQVTGIGGINAPPPGPTPVPEPTTLVLVGLALAGLGVQRRRAARS